MIEITSIHEEVKDQIKRIDALRGYL